ncbi:MAG: hypothetical protein K0R21_1438 [Anaerocolumna sp.]|jgi:hypothetical protein|nr:hypothetical protein [Anaerocolumna sp.]
MNIGRLFKDEDGAVLPFVALLLMLVLTGFTALVIDVGYLYSNRRSLVTAADAAALGGAMILEEALSDPALEPEDVKDEAVKVAKDLGEANGVKNREDIVIEVKWKKDGPNEYNRDYIVVTVKNNYEMIFAKLFGIDTSDVTAKAVATWGYDTKIEGGDILPIFTKSDDYQTESVTYLHSGKFVDTEGSVVNGNWGLIDIYGNTAGIAEAFRGENIGKRMELGATIDNQTGLNSGNVTNPIEERMRIANDLPDREDRVKYMCGLVPVIKWEDIEKQGSSLKLPIEYFAVFEIYDVIVHGAHNDNQKSRGSQYALYDTANYKSDNIAVEYEKVNGEFLEDTTIIGKFTGVRVEINAIPQPGDQENPNPEIISPTYAELIE